MIKQPVASRRCFREPIAQARDVARYLDAAVSAHLAQRGDVALELFALANDSALRAWLESIWGAKSAYVRLTKLPPIPGISKSVERRPTKEQVAALHRRDGFTCRYCGLPVIRPSVRQLAAKLYPTSVPWGKSNASQHAGFQALWAQYDHVVPHSSGGTNDLDNLVVSCAACNFGKMSHRLEELDLLDPRGFPASPSLWDGLERLLPQKERLAGRELSC